jgi:aspartate/methionine/tyrosine aminotransferase
MSLPLQFPYMFWAHQEGVLSPYCLSQSGMPVPPSDFLQGLEVDISHPCVEAQPALEARLGELFGVDPKRVIATVGASSAMQLVAMGWFRAGATVAVEVPSYEPLRKLPGFFGADLVPLRRRPEALWEITPQDVRAALAGCSGPGHVFLTNPNNPTGAIMDEERMLAIAAEAAAAGGLLVSGEVYMEFLPNDRRVHAFDLAPNTISIGSMTKAYGLGALRIGWLILGEGVARDSMHLMDMSYLAYVDPPTPSLMAARVALDHLPELLKPVARVQSECRPMWERWLSETPGIECHVPEFGIVAFPRIDGIEDTAALSVFLRENFKVDAVPGEYFGLAGHLRVGCGVPAETLRVGLEQLGAGIEAFRKQLK